VVVEPDNKSEGDKGMGAGNALVVCLQRLAKHHGIAVTAEALVAGLPTTLNDFTPDLLVRSAKRVGIKARLQQVSVASLPRNALPVIVLIEDEKAVLLESVSDDGNALIFDPLQSPDLQPIALSELAAVSTGFVLLARPKFRLRASQLGGIGGQSEHWFWSVMHEHRGLYRDVLYASLFINILALALPIFTMNVYDRVVPNAAFETLWVLAAGVLLAVLADVGLRVMRGFFLDYAARRIDVDLSAAIVEKTLGMRLEHKPISVGSYAASLRSFEFLRDITTSASLTGFIDIPFAFVFLLVVAWISPYLLIPIVIGIALLLIVALAIRPKLEQLTETTYAASAQRNSTLIETLSGLETLKAMGAESVMQRQWEEATRFLASQNLRSKNVQQWLSQISSALQRFVQVLVIVFGVYLIAAGQLSMGGLIACMMISSRATAPFAKLGSLITQYQNARVAMQAMDSLFETPSEYRQESGVLSRESFAGAYEFKNVSFKYPNTELQSLSAASLKIKAGEHVAILGRVGSGKSTLSKLALGLFQATEGEIRVDGVDIRQLDPHEYRSAVGYVPQDVTLFSGTLRDNIALGRPSITDAQLIKAVECAGIADWVNRHPLGFDMPISERGDSVSGGQKKCIAVARALVTDPSILIMDEPTGGTDQTTERTIIENLESFMQGRTLIVVTHRNSLLALVDRILVVDRGKIVADGPKDAVVNALRQGKIGRADD
jgi:ATP-binding cassette subfamily C protein LapB